jgi:hypothetical protein
MSLDFVALVCSVHVTLKRGLTVEACTKQTQVGSWFGAEFLVTPLTTLGSLYTSCFRK